MNELEAILFAAGDDGLSINEISNILEIEEDEVKKLIENLEKSYSDRAIELSFLGNKYKLTTSIFYL